MFRVPCIEQDIGFTYRQAGDTRPELDRHHIVAAHHFVLVADGERDNLVLRDAPVYDHAAALVVNQESLLIQHAGHIWQRDEPLDLAVVKPPAIPAKFTAKPVRRRCLQRLAPAA